MKSWIFVSYCLVGRIIKEYPLSAPAIMASLFLSLVCMDLMVLVSGCLLCLVWELLFITRMFMSSAVSFLYTSRSEEWVLILLFRLLVRDSVSCIHPNPQTQNTLNPFPSTWSIQRTYGSHDYSHQLAGCTIFFTIDFVRAHHQIPVHPDDVQKTAITTTFGLFEFLFVSFGLCNVAQTFQSFTDEILMLLTSSPTSMTSWYTRAHRRSTSDTSGPSSNKYRPTGC